MGAVDPNFQKVLLTVLASWVLFFVFAASAVAFVLMLFNVLKPTVASRRYLFGVFAVTGVSVFVGVAADFLKFDPAIIRDTAVREDAREQSGQLPAGSADARITIFTQVSTENERGKFAVMKNTLAGGRYDLPGVEVVNKPINSNQIRYCNDANEKDARVLKSLLEKAGFNQFQVIKIMSCTPDKNRNLLEVWLQRG